MANGAAIEMTKRKLRPVVRLDEVTMPTAADAAPTNDPTTGRFVKGNRAHRRRQLKSRARGIATMNPATAPTWLRPFIEQGAPYVTSLLEMLGERPSSTRWRAMWQTRTACISGFGPWPCRPRTGRTARRCSQRPVAGFVSTVRGS